MHGILLPAHLPLPVLFGLGLGRAQKRLWGLLPDGPAPVRAHADFPGAPGPLCGGAAAVLGGAAAVLPLLWEAPPPAGGPRPLPRRRQQPGPALDAGAVPGGGGAVHGAHLLPGALLHLPAAPGGRGPVERPFPGVWHPILPAGRGGQRQQPGEFKLPGGPLLHRGNRPAGAVPVAGAGGPGRRAAHQPGEGLPEKLCGQRLHRGELGAPVRRGPAGALQPAAGPAAPDLAGPVLPAVHAPQQLPLPGFGGERQRQPPVRLHPLRPGGKHRGHRPDGICGRRLFAVLPLFRGHAHLHAGGVGAFQQPGLLSQPSAVRHFRGLRQQPGVQRL